jgi:hypothetical protein
LLYQSRYSRKVTNIAGGPIHLKYGICQHFVIWHARRRLGAGGPLPRPHTGHQVP